MAAPIDIGTLIECTPGVVGGRPRIAGTRIAVDHIAALLIQGLSVEQIGEAYSHLNLAQIHAAASYFFANRQAVEQSLAAEDAAYESLAASQPART